MMRILFFFMGVPMILMSFFETIDVLPFVSNAGIIADGHEVVLTQDEQNDLKMQVQTLLENSRTVPAFGVIFDDMYHEEIKNGYFVTLKFDNVFEINGLPFDELVFKVEPDYCGFNIFRGMNGIYQGRCIYVELENKSMKDLYDYIENLDSVKNALTDNDLQDANQDKTDVDEGQIEENLPNEDENLDISSENKDDKVDTEQDALL